MQHIHQAWSPQLSLLARLKSHRSLGNLFRKRNRVMTDLSSQRRAVLARTGEMEGKGRFRTHSRADFLRFIVFMARFSTRVCHPPRSSSAGLHDAATYTPSGAQKNACQPPVKGQCWGIKKDGDRCSRMQGKGAVSPSPKSRQRPGNSRGASAPVRLGKGTSAMDPFVLDDSDDDGGTSASPTRQKGRAHSSPPSNTAKLADTPAAEDADEWYCHTHISEVNKTVGFYVRRPNSQTLGQNPSDRYITYSDWFQTVSLSNQTQAFLRKCMAQPPSDKDRDEGYLYVYELRDRSTTSHLCLKVGRTKHVFRRHGEWRSQCHSEPHLLWFCPSTENQGLHPGLHPTEVPGVPLSHRWETLVHLELSSIGERTNEICHNCGARHREIFMIPRSVRSTGSQL